MTTAKSNSAASSERAAFLRAEIERHNRLYYVEARPELSDREYDALFDELRRIEAAHPALATPDSPTRRVGGAPLTGFETVRHSVPMLSLEKAEDRRELMLFDARVRGALPDEPIEYVVEPKVDGVSISALYHDGLFARGATRGDGRTGDDITANLRTIRQLPLRLAGARPPARFEARGEAYMRDADREALNARLTAAGEKPFVNARNATAGSLKLLDPAVVATRPLRAVFYGLGEVAGAVYTTHAEELEALRAAGLPVPQFWERCADMDEALACADRFKAREQELPYEIDGIVIKLNKLDQCRRLGATARAPASAIAYKPRHWLKQTVTRLRAITLQVGRSGVITPVAELEPVFLDGTTIARATLHNEEDIRRKDVRVGDWVVIERAGKVIPYVVRAVTERRTGAEQPFAMPGRCPVCGGPVTRRAIAGGADEAALRCDNLQCPAQQTRRIEYCAQRQALDIEGLGGIVADKLVERGLAGEPLDLFKLDATALAGLNLGTDEKPRILGAPNAAKIMAALERARTLPLDRWLCALAIPDVGETLARTLARLHPDLEAVADSALLRDLAALADEEAAAEKINPRSRAQPPRDDTERAERAAAHAKLLTAIGARRARLAAHDLGELGPAAARSVLDWFAAPAGQTVRRRLRELGIHPRRAADTVTPGAGPLTDKTFVLTGTLPTLTRDRAKELILAAGGHVAGSVSRKTDYVVAGAEAGSKLADAQRLGIAILDEAGLLGLLQTTAAVPPAPPPRKQPKPEQGRLLL